MRGVFQRFWDEVNEQAPKPESPAFEPLPPDTEDTEPISQLILSLPRYDHIRNLGETLLAGRPVNLSDVSPLVAAVASCGPKKWRRGVVAAWCLGRVELPAEERAAVAGRLSAVVDNRIPYDHLGVAFGRLFKVSGVLTIAAALPILVYTFPEWGRSAGTVVGAAAVTIVLGMITFLLLSGVAVGPVLIPLSVSADKTRTNRVRAQAAETLGILRSPESVDGLTSAAQEVVSRVRAPAREALWKVLPTLRPEHRGTLSAATVPALCRLLNDSEGYAAMTILGALENVGDGRAVKPVQQTIMRWSDGPVRREAERILPILMDRQRQERASTVLLRAAEPTEGLLVRPAVSPPSQDAEALVRPADL